MLLLPGSDALSAPRFKRLSNEIAKHDSRLKLTRAFFVYAIESMDDVDAEQLSALLQPGTSPTPRGDELAQNEIVIVTPRIGTISPWSSKATNIANNLSLIHI